eukprot:1175499-Prorocentrum_minimum.AAC.3
MGAPAVIGGKPMGGQISGQQPVGTAAALTAPPASSEAAGGVVGAVAAVGSAGGGGGHGGGGFSGGGGGGRPGDWICDQCQNDNFAFRTECK